jgi:hypothetical protein
MALNGIVDMLYIIDILHNTEIEDNWGIGLNVMCLKTTL